MRIWTIGHSTRSLAELVDMLKKHEIDILVDVRSFPGSRANPQFNKEKLAQVLPECGIDYTHFKGLGGLRPLKKDMPKTVWRNKGFEAYAYHMETEEFANDIGDLITLAEHFKVAYMCSEAVWWRCHRSMISDYLKVRGHEVRHIMDDNPEHDTLHPYTTAAKIIDNQLSYAA